ncbi:hypothetical protein [Streptomyces sp. NPDC091268]|uniref:hypothetical protein n=1 Tax=Streptomyces sp. NPDC091268 TaxID=3365979 RepID=UPI003824465F
MPTALPEQVRRPRPGWTALTVPKRVTAPYAVPPRGPNCPDCDAISAPSATSCEGRL